MFYLWFYNLCDIAYTINPDFKDYTKDTYALFSKSMKYLKEMLL